MAMPPAAAQAPQGMEEGAEGESPSGKGVSGQDLIVGVQSGLAKVAQLAAANGAPDDVVAQLESALESYRGAIEALMSGEAGQPAKAPAPGGAGSASPEQGGNPNAVPMG